MTEIRPNYEAQVFLPPPGLNRQFRTVGRNRVKIFGSKLCLDQML